MTKWNRLMTDCVCKKEYMYNFISWSKAHLPVKHCMCSVEEVVTLVLLTPHTCQ